MHSPIIFDHCALTFPHKICFQDFSATVHYGDRIAIMGRNGSGKSSLLKALCHHQTATTEGLQIPKDVVFGYVAQLTTIENLSGGESFQAALTQALSMAPNCLLLDEPTNHLDAQHKQSLVRMLERFSGTLILTSHDEDVLEQCFDTFWHIHEGKIYLFKGNYRDYRHSLNQQENQRTTSKNQLKKAQKVQHERLMQAQSRAAKSRKRGEKNAANAKWSPIVANLNAAKAQRFAGQSNKALNQCKMQITEALADLYIPKIVLPSFAFSHVNVTSKQVVAINNGALYYGDHPLLTQINLKLCGTDRRFLAGANGSGKTSLVKAILLHSGDKKFSEHMHLQGTWQVPQRPKIGYLDQHYTELNPHKTVLESVKEQVPKMGISTVRDYLNRFLFRNNAQVAMPTKYLSGGEKARLALALMVLKNPEFLLLDELSNNLDRETKDHIINVLNAYNGALLVISHESWVLKALNIPEGYEITRQTIVPKLNA